MNLQSQPMTSAAYSITEKRMHRLGKLSSPLAIATLTALLTTACTTTEGTTHVSVGPQLGYTWSTITSRSGISYGLEATGGDFPFLKASAGWLRRPRVEPPTTPDDDTYAHLLYLAWEPWYLLGATLGGAWSPDGGPQLAAGAWEGFQPAIAELGPPGWHVEPSLAIGLRFLGRAVEIYLTPKVSFRYGGDTVTTPIGSNYVQE